MTPQEHRETFTNAMHEWVAANGVMFTGPYTGDGFMCAVDLNKLKLGVALLIIAFGGQLDSEAKPASGHDLVREIIAKHGVDRYPTVELIMMKLTEELGELARELLRGDGEAARKEYGDVGLTLHALGNRLGYNLDAEMFAVVDGETRRFD